MLGFLLTNLWECKNICVISSIFPRSNNPRIELKLFDLIPCMYGVTRSVFLYDFDLRFEPSFFVVQNMRIISHFLEHQE